MQGFRYTTQPQGVFQAERRTIGMCVLFLCHFALFSSLEREIFYLGG